MSILSKVKRRTQKLKLDDIELEITELPSDYMEQMMNLEIQLETGKYEEAVKNMMELVDATIKEAVPDATDEEIKNLGIRHIKSFMIAIQEVNQGAETTPEQREKLENARKRAEQIFKKE